MGVLIGIRNCVFSLNLYFDFFPDSWTSSSQPSKARFLFFQESFGRRRSCKGTAPRKPLAETRAQGPVRVSFPSRICETYLPVGWAGFLAVHRVVGSGSLPSGSPRVRVVTRPPWGGSARTPSPSSPAGARRSPQGAPDLALASHITREPRRPRVRKRNRPSPSSLTPWRRGRRCPWASWRRGRGRASCGRPCTRRTPSLRRRGLGGAAAGRGSRQ